MTNKQLQDDMLRSLYHYRTKPKWTDRCGHGGYLFTFTWVTPRGEETVDVYCWDNHGTQEFCLRYGNDDPDYCSPGGLENVLHWASGGHEPYAGCVRMLRNMGSFEFVPTEEADDPPTEVS